ncbi:unnamed protein product [Sphenostylis stenocarpa]|uniref:Uncharacterized protein n=1 Tax=Sphenostylis stenocarpa TaxID=92480 RepID=A0AA86S4N8_9FABA|nr:unnamed protein product [Sphenostylis stenocarpa]
MAAVCFCATIGPTRLEYASRYTTTHLYNKAYSYINLDGLNKYIKGEFRETRPRNNS